MKHIKIFLAAAFLIAAAVPHAAEAANLFITPASGTYNVGDTISAKVAVSSDTSVNAVSAGLSFSNDTLSVLSISKSGSFISFWAQEPSFSSQAGTVDVEGVSLGSGYTGSSGTVVTVVFRAKAAGDAYVSFRSGSILANDGQGTDVTENRRGANYTIAAADSGVSVPVQTGAAPVSVGIPIHSATHPDSTKWYDNDSPRFDWTLPADAEEVRILLDESPYTNPTKSYIPAISARTVEDLSDGTHYFHLQVRGKSGWSAVSHFKVNIDTTQPRSFVITFPHGVSTVEPQPVILFNTTDAASGIAYYEVKVGSGGPLKATTPGVDSNPYVLPLLEPGHYVVAVTAYDEAGNTTTGESDFTVEGIEAPKITYYPRELTVGDVFKVRGTSYADADIELTIYDKDGNEVTVEPGKSNSLNDFAITLSKRLGPGEYTFSVRATDSRGARSPLTEPVKFSVGFHLVADALAFAANYFIIVVIFLLAVAGVAAVGIWSFYRLLHLSSTLRKERKEAETTIKKAFRLLKGDLEDHIARLHRARSDRTLTAEELSFLEQFEKDLREAEDIIKDEFDDIPKA